MKRTGVLLAISVILLAQSPSPSKIAYTTNQKAFYAADALVQFVRAGLVVKILSANIAADRTISAVYTVTDPQGLPLDAAGINTPGPLTIRLIAASIPKGQDQYVSYTTRTSTGATLASTVQAAADKPRAVGPAAPRLSLDDYLRRRNGAAR